MRTLALGLSCFVALAHVGFFALEGYFWTRPLGAKVFRRPQQFMKDSASLALNQGLYNGFLAAGLLWGVWLHTSDPAHALSVLTFFLGCVVVAGVVGAATASRSILFVQALPGALALGASLLSR